MGEGPWHLYTLPKDIDLAEQLHARCHLAGQYIEIIKGFIVHKSLGLSKHSCSMAEPSTTEFFGSSSCGPELEELLFDRFFFYTAHP